VVAAYVRGLIISGQVKPGEFLRMEPIAEAVGVSNTPVREGLLTLRSDGFVRLVPHRGFVVAPFSPEDVHDLFWAQAKLAGELSARAAQRMTPERLQRIAAVHKAHEAATESGNLERVSELGHKFHSEINKAARSYRLAELLDSIVQQVPPEFYVGIPGHIASTGKHHRRLVTAMRKGDAERARFVMEEHVLEGAKFLNARLKELGVFADTQAAAS
jgi:DNA-binding GntR family transcriptional regulator